MIWAANIRDLSFVGLGVSRTGPSLSERVILGFRSKNFTLIDIGALSSFYKLHAQL